MTTATTEARVYVGTYAKYNDGNLKGAWLVLDGHDQETFRAACAQLHADEADPELMYQDFEGFPREFYGECSLSPQLWEWLDLSDDDRELLARYCDATGEADATIDQARDRFQGTADTGADFAENIAQECGDIPKDLPDWIAGAIDWEAAWNRSLRYDYTTSESADGTLYFFTN
jgi:antirestriction protein